MPQWPGEKRFAFTIVDDTDRSTIENTKPIYDFLYEHGFRTTKTVWPLAPSQRPITGGTTLEDSAYRTWVLELRAKGFEIAFHGATDHASRREETIAALDFLKKILGEDPKVYAVHTGQTEGMYFGVDRFHGLHRHVYRAFRRFGGGKGEFEGHVRESPYFWGDICASRILYTRNFTFDDINTLKVDPFMPYHDPRRPHVQFWFSSSNGSGVDSYCALLSARNQDRLVEEGGACIVYTHLGSTFSEGGKPKAGFACVMKRLSRLPGWFAPASQILDHLRSQNEWQRQIDPSSSDRLERRWLYEKLRPSRKLLTRLKLRALGAIAS